MPGTVSDKRTRRTRQVSTRSHRGPSRAPPKMEGRLLSRASTRCHSVLESTPIEALASDRSFRYWRYSLSHARAPPDLTGFRVSPTAPMDATGSSGGGRPCLLRGHRRRRDAVRISRGPSAGRHLVPGKRPSGLSRGWSPTWESRRRVLDGQRRLPLDGHRPLRQLASPERRRSSMARGVRRAQRPAHARLQRDLVHLRSRRRSGAGREPPGRPSRCRRPSGAGSDPHVRVATRVRTPSRSGRATSRLVEPATSTGLNGPPEDNLRAPADYSSASRERAPWRALETLRWAGRTVAKRPRLRPRPRQSSPS